MSKNIKRTAAILTISDSCSAGKTNDESGPALKDFLESRKNFEVQ